MISGEQLCLGSRGFTRSQQFCTVCINTAHLCHTVKYSSTRADEQLQKLHNYWHLASSTFPLLGRNVGSKPQDTTHHTHIHYAYTMLVSISTSWKECRKESCSVCSLLLIGPITIRPPFVQATSRLYSIIQFRSVVVMEMSVMLS